MFIPPKSVNYEAFQMQDGRGEIWPPMFKRNFLEIYRLHIDKIYTYDRKKNSLQNMNISIKFQKIQKSYNNIYEIKRSHKVPLRN